MSQKVFDAVEDILDAVTYRIERYLGPPERIDEEKTKKKKDEVDRVQKRLFFMSMHLSTLLYVVWVPSRRSITLQPRFPSDMREQVQIGLRNAIRNRVTMQTQHTAHVLMGASIRKAFADMIEFMKEISGEDEDDGRQPARNPTGGYAARHPFVLFQQLCEVTARQLVEQLLWWLSSSGGELLRSIASEDPSFLPLMENDQREFPSRAAAFLRVVPVMQFRIRDIGTDRCARVIAMETRCQMLQALSELEDATNDPMRIDVEDDEVPSSGLPSVEVMMDSVKGLRYDASGKIAVTVDSQMLEDAVRAGSSDKSSTTVQAERTNRSFAARILESGLVHVAYENRLPEYTLGIVGAERVADKCADAVRKVLRGILLTGSG